MVKTWLVHRNDQTFGPWSAEQIRSELRKGTIDPFDLVNLEGSPVMRELVEVDEIFQSADVEYQEGSIPNQQLGASPEASPAEPTETNNGTFLALAEPNVEKRVTKNSSKSSPRKQKKPKKDEGIIARIKGKDKDQTRSPKSKSEGNISYEIAKKGMAASQSGSVNKDAKRYFLIDGKGRIFGPKSASEIQTMFFRGLLGADVSVKKDQSEVAVPISKFVDVYAQAKGAGQTTAVIGHSPRANVRSVGSQGTMQTIGSHAVTGVRLLRTSRYLTLFSVVILIVSIAIGVFAYQSANKSNRSGMSSRVVIDKKTTKKPKVRKKTRKNRLKPRSKPRARPKEKSRAKPRVKNRGSGTGSLARPNGRDRKKFIYAKTTQTSKGNKIKPLERIRPRTRSSGRSSPIALAASSSGSVMTLGPLKFKPTDLNNCSLKCDIPMRDGTGRSIRVVFFKAAFNNKLAGKSGKVYITGRVSGGGKTLFLQGIK